jgi:hypothetical protein
MLATTNSYVASYVTGNVSLVLSEC